jgi:hypothetical protein
MSQKALAAQEWRRLYSAAADVRDIAPWEYLSETDVFGVMDPETKRTGFVSATGVAGEYCAIVVYLGAEGLYGFWDLQHADQEDLENLVFEIPHLHLAFEDRGALDNNDRDAIKQSGIKFRGRGSWPMFRSYRPGFLPWYMEPHEVRFMTCVLEQLLDVAPRYLNDVLLLAPEDEFGYLVRVPRKRRDTILWSDKIVQVTPPEPSDILIALDQERVSDVMNLRRDPGTVEVDFFMVPVIIHEEGTRPFYPYLLLTMDVRSGKMFSGELLRVSSTLEDMWGKIPGHFADQLLQIGHIPRTVTVRSSLLAELFKPLAEELDFTLVVSDELSNLEPAKMAFIDHLSGRSMN